jgi:hypothetical protein
MSKLVTSGTGHVSGARLSPGPKGTRTPPHGGDKKIGKARFGFKGIAENFSKPIGGADSKLGSQRRF